MHRFVALFGAPLVPAAVALLIALAAQGTALGQLAEPDYRRVVVQDGYAYVGTPNSGVLRALTLVDPRRPAQVGTLSTAPLGDWSASGRYLYLFHGYLFSVVDVADPAHLTTASEPGGYVKRAVLTTIAGDVLYVVQWAPDARVRLDTWSLADPIRPSVVGGAYVDQPTIQGARPVVSGGFAFVGTGVGLYVFDVRDPTRPTQVGFYGTQSVATVAVAGTHAYVGTSDGTLHVLDVSTASRPTLVTTMPSPGGVWWATLVVGDRLYVGADRGLQVLSLADASRPLLLGGETNAPRGYDVAVVGPWGYVASGSAGLRVLDVSDPARPNQVGSAVLAQVRLPLVPQNAGP